MTCKIDGEIHVRVLLNLLYPHASVDRVTLMNGYTTKRNGSGQPWTVDLNRDRYRELVTAKGWNTQPEQAEALGLSQQTISRIVECDGYPSGRFIAALKRAFPDEDFDSLFVIVEDRPLRRVAA